MANLLLPSRNTKQPQHSVQIDWGNPVTNGLLAVDLPGLGYGVVNQNQATGNAPVVAGPVGQQYSLTASSSQYSSIPVTRSLVDGATHLLVFIPNLSSGNNYQRGSTLSGPTHHRSFLQLFDGGGGAYSSIQLGGCLGSEYNNSYANFSANTQSGVNTLLGYWGQNGATAGIMHNGKLSTGALNSTGTPFGTSASLDSGRLLYVGSPYYGDFTGIALNAVWDRALSTSELLALNDNPWQIFAPQKRVIYFDAGAGGGDSTKLVTDSIFSSDTLSNIQVQVSTTESGNAFETNPIGASLGITDSLSLIDTLQGILNTLAIQESGISSDVLAAVQVALLVAESATGLEDLSLLSEALKQIAETGTLVDNIAEILVALSLAETGSILDSVSKIAEGFINLSETGIISDSITGLSVTTGLADAITSLDAVIAKAQVAILENANVSELVALLSATLLAINETAIGSDTLNPLNISFSIPEIANGSENLAISNILTIFENSGILDSIVKYDPEANVISVKFALEARAVSFVLPTRNTTFILIPRGTIQ